MDLNSIVFTISGLFIGGIAIVLTVSFLAYKLRSKQTYKFPVQKFQPQEYLQPSPATIPIQHYQAPVQYQQPKFQYSNNHQPVHNYRRSVSLYQVYN
jgi:hypothetical protein